MATLKHPNQNYVIAHSIAIPNTKLFVLFNFSLYISRSNSPPSSAHYTSSLLGIDTRHKHLRHCGVDAVFNMAWSSNVKGITTDTSHPHFKCKPCIFSKQTCYFIPKVRESLRAVKHLECVYVDLCGPMSISSCSGRLYSMNIIDDYSSFIWSSPLHSKSEVAPMLKAWLLAIEVQTNYHLQSFVIDNGKLCLSQIRNCCL